MLVGISGIDGSGKGFISELISDQLTRKGFRTAVINIDGWLNLPEVRFDLNEPAGNFYRNGIRFSAMFDQLVLPLKENRSVTVTADLTEETASKYHKHTYSFENVDIVLLEGIFLFKREFTEIFDLRIWIDCSFEVALERAIKRSQEGLAADETVKAYDSIYFPAQRLHFKLDDPRAIADVIIDNGR